MSSTTRADVLAAIDRSGDCWKWTGRIEGGRPRLMFEGTDRLVHRLVYEWLIGPLEKWGRLGWTCSTPWCLNPAHMFQKSNFDNVSNAERAAWKASGESCARGHAKVVHGRRDSGGNPYCAECNRTAPARRLAQSASP